MTKTKTLVALAAAAWVAGCSGGETGPGTDAGVPDGGEIPDVCTDEAPCALTPGERATEYIGEVGDTIPTPSTSQRRGG